MEETDTGGKESQEMEEKPRWIDLFQRESHRQFQMEYLRDKEYEEIVTTLRRSITDPNANDDDEDDDTSSKDSPPFHIPIPAEQYFLTPDPSLHSYAAAAGYGHGHRSGSSGSYSSSQSVSSFGASTVTTSAPASSRGKCLPPEVVEAKKKSRRKRTVAFICLGVLSLALVALAIGVILHFLLESGSIGHRGREEGLMEKGVVQESRSTGHLGREEGSTENGMVQESSSVGQRGREEGTTQEGVVQEATLSPA